MKACVVSASANVVVVVEPIHAPLPSLDAQGIGGGKTRTRVELRGSAKTFTSASRPLGGNARSCFSELRVRRVSPSGPVCSSWARRESILVDAREAELVSRRWIEFHKEALRFEQSWGTYAC